MWLISLGLIFAASLLLTGCSRIIYPGDGRLVIVEIDPDMDNCPISDTTVGALARAGILYWNQAGARLRMLDQLASEEQAEVAMAPRLRIHGDACSGLGANPSGNVGQYNYYSGDIELFLKNWGGLTPIEITTEIAHEAGHAIGLDHVPEHYAVMFANPDPQYGLTDPDLREHARVWP